MSSLLVRAGRLVYSAGKLVLGSAQACIDLCCGTPPEQWYCVYVPDENGNYATMCLQAPFPEGAVVGSGPHSSSSSCLSVCTGEYGYYCCYSPESEGTYVCHLGEGCPEGSYVAFGPSSSEEGCMSYCNGYTMGACCPKPCDPSPDYVPISGGDCYCQPTTCEEASSAWVRNDCGVCEEQAKPSDPPSLSWVSDGCYVYAANSCDGVTEGQLVGYATEAGCKYRFREYQPCQETYAPDCLQDSGWTGWHPGQTCSQVPCPTDCYATAEPSKCDGVTEAPAPTGPLGCTSCRSFPDELSISFSHHSPAGCTAASFSGLFPDAAEASAVQGAVSGMLNDLASATHIMPISQAISACFFIVNDHRVWKRQVIERTDGSGHRLLVTVYISINFSISYNYLGSWAECEGGNRWDALYGLTVVTSYDVCDYDPSHPNNTSFAGPYEGIGSPPLPPNFQFFSIPGGSGNAIFQGQGSATTRRLNPYGPQQACDCYGIKECSEAGVSVPLTMTFSNQPCLEVFEDEAATIDINTP